MHCMGSNSSNSIAKTRLEYVGSLTSHCIISTCKPFWEPMENGDTLGRAVSKIDAISTQEEYKVLLDLHVQYEDSTQAASNSHFSSLDQQPQYRMSLQQIAIDANAYNRWKQIATAQGLITDTQIANFLTQHYEVTVSGGQYAICCLTCHTPLSLLCAKCRLMQQHTDLNQSCSLSLQTSGESETPSNTADASLQENNQPASTKREILKNEVLSLPAFNFGSRDNSLPFESSFASGSQTSGLTTLVNLQIENHEILSDGSQTNEQNVTSETKGSVTRKLKGKGTKFKDKKDITCKECGCQVPHYVNAKKHSVVSSADRSHVCHDCGAAFAHSRNLKAHFWKKHSSLEKPFQCEVCEKSFLNLRDLQTHTYKHTGELPYKCSYCPSAFRLACNLKTHLRVHTGERPFKCNMCEKAFTESGALKVHVRKHTGEKPFKCNRCEMAFPSSGNLARHVLTHTGEKPYRCTHCEAAFSQPSSLKTHIRTHTGERPYKCEHCGAAFSDNSTLWKHKRKHSCQGSIHVRNKKPAVIISPTLTAELPLGLVAGLQAVEAEAQISTTETAVMVTQSTASSPPTVLIPGARSSQGAIITSNGQHTQNSQHTLFIAHTLPETSLVNTVGWCFPMQ